MRMCMKAKTPAQITPAPTPTPQTDDLNTKANEQWFTEKKRKRSGYDSTILAQATSGTGKTTLGG